MGNRPLVVHRDKKVYLIKKPDDKDYEIEDQLYAYATLVHAPKNVHTYKLDEDSLWSATLLGYKEEDILNFLKENSKNKIPQSVIEYIKETIKEFWEMELFVDKDEFELIGNNYDLYKLLNLEDIRPKVKEQKNDRLIFERKNLYNVRDRLLKEKLYLREINKPKSYCDLKLNSDIELYEYQKEAVKRFLNPGKGRVFGRGLITMPPGSGKTIVALKIIEILGVSTLILVEDKDSYEAWLKEIKEKTNFDTNNVSYNNLGSNKPISICTYSYVTKKLSSDFNSTWGLIIYDDANLLPAKRRSRAAYITSKYKLAMDSIIWRSDNNENLIFKAIGPKIYNVPLEKLEEEGYQIKVKCYEIKIPFKPWDKEEEKDKNHTTSKNFKKIDAYRTISNKHKGEKSILVSYYVKVAEKFNEALDIPLYDRNVKEVDREQTIDSFNKGEISSIVFTDTFRNQPLKDIDVLVSLSYHGKSPREEFKRIGKLKSSNKDKKKTGYYYALVTQDKKEEEVYDVRKSSMLKHGYTFKVMTIDELEELSNEF